MLQITFLILVFVTYCSLQTILGKATVTKMICVFIDTEETVHLAPSTDVLKISENL